MEAMATLFERLGKGRPPPEEKIKQPRSDLEPAQKLLDFLQRWTKKTVSERDIRIYGPGTLRGRESAIKAAEILVKNGWLIPREGPRRRSRAWEIVHKPIVRPAVAG
jgi:hypothetical protein